MPPDENDGTRAPACTAADAYAKALAAAGGEELEALARDRGGGAVCTAIYASPSYDLLVPALPVSRLSVNLTRARVCGGFEGERPRRYEALPYSMFLVPAGVPVAWRKGSPSRHLSIYFNPVLGGSNSDGAVFDREHPVFNTRIAGIRPLVDQLGAELDRPDPLTAEAADSLARLLLVRLARHLGDTSVTANPLTPRILARLRDYVVAHLTERILVADLAREAVLSPHHFAHAFSEHTGQSPHQFVLGLRLDRAAQLLRTSTLNLVDVAHDCGFADQQHLCNAMRRHLGTTPSRYRRTHQPAHAAKETDGARDVIGRSIPDSR